MLFLPVSFLFYLDFEEDTFERGSSRECQSADVHPDLESKLPYLLCSGANLVPTGERRPIEVSTYLLGRTRTSPVYLAQGIRSNQQVICKVVGYDYHRLDG